jgi:hypothetical protein
MLPKTMKKGIYITILVTFLISTECAQNKPVLADKLSAEFPESQYISERGYGRDRETAANNAKGKLAAYFRQSIKNGIKVIEKEYQENGLSTTILEVSQAIEANTELNSLSGVKIKDYGVDNRGDKSYLAVAIMEKARGREWYTGELTKIITEINLLIGIINEPSFEMIARSQAAKKQLPNAETFALILKFLDGPDRRPELSQVIIKLHQMEQAIKAIPFDIRVKGDQNEQIKNKFANAFKEYGLNTGNSNPKFVLNVDFSFKAAEKIRNFNTEYTVNAVLNNIDRKSVV